MHHPIKNLTLLVFLVFATGCRQSVSVDDLKHLNGYWEIDYVRLANGDRKDYKINETVDFFELKKSSGFRKKLKPQFDGTYIDNNQSERIALITTEAGTFLKYQTSYSTWQEEVVEVSDDALVLKNDQDIMYYYKRPIPFTIK